MNPFKIVGGIIGTIVYFLFHPKELSKALLDPKTQGIYHLSSVNTFVPTFGASVAYPNWARDLAASAKGLWISIKDGPIGAAASAAWDVLLELLSGTP